MADISTILDDSASSKKAAYYDDSEEKPNVPMPEGTYPAHIISANQIVRDIRGQFKAVIYNVVVKIAKEASEYKFDAVDYDGNEVNVSGGMFTGWDVRSTGIFRFLHPEEDDNFDANPGGNKGYANFCTVVGKEPKKVKVQLNGEKVQVKELPNLVEEDLLGKPVKAVIGRGKPWTGDDGKTRTSLEVKWFRSWVEGNDLDPSALEDDDLPF